MGYVDAGPALNVLHSPRLNCNVEDSILVAKKCFAEGLYLNVMPKKPDEASASAWISENPPLSAALQELAGLRKQFLPYFVDGTPIGEAVLSESASGFVRAYLLGPRLLVIVLNDRGNRRQIPIQSNLELWLPTAHSYQVKYYNAQGKLLETSSETSQWFAATRPLEPMEMALFEVKAE
jgi:hypothetical protein